MKTLDAVDVLAAFTASTPFDQLPADVRAHAPWVLLDVIGTTLAGSEAQQVSALATACALGADAPVATVLRRGLPRSSPVNAAWLNGISAVWLELDPGHRRWRTHAPAHVMPAALAEAQRVGADGAQLLAAFVLGCEAAYRMGAATTPRPEVNAHGTWGIVGAAVAVSRLRGLDVESTARALRLASHLALATSLRTSIAGATVRNVYVGAAAQSALQSVSLAQAGFTALDDAPAVVFGQVLGTDFDAGWLTDALGTRFEFMHDFAKLHACCHHLYPAVDALQDLLASGRPLADAVQAIVVHTYAVAARFSQAAPANELAAKFSLPYVLANSLGGATLDPQAFREPTLGSPAVLSLAARVEVHEDPALTARFPQERPARVELRLCDGTSRSVERSSPRGDYLDPMDAQTRSAKFDALAAAVLPAGSAARLRERLLLIEREPNVSHLFDLEPQAIP